MTAGNILGGIIAKLRREFAEDIYSIYTESVEQDLCRPCFFILLREKGRKQTLNNRFKYSFKYEIIYYPSHNGDINEECILVSESLSQILSTVTAKGDLIRGKVESNKVEGKKLKFVTEFTMFVLENEDEGEKMEEVAIYGKS